MANAVGSAGVQPDTSSSSCSINIAKRHKTGDWEDLKVTYCKATVRPQCGVTEEGTYSTRTGRKTESVNNIKRDIMNIEGKAEIGGKQVIYHNAFKAALQCILTMLHDSNDDHRLLLIHGVSSIGKSTLAATLAYHLAQSGTDATLVKFDNAKVTNNKRNFADQVGHYLAFYRDEYVILDQLDVNRLDSTSFQKWWIDNDPRKPVVAFTSGHYASPSVLWKKSIFISYKVIDLQVDVDGVKAILEDVLRHQESLLDPKEVLQVTRNFGRVCKLVVMSGGKKVTQEEMADHLYDLTKFYNLAAEKKTIFWSVWSKYCHASDEELKKAQKPEDWKLTSDEVELFNRLTSNSETHDKRTNKYLDYFDILAETGSEEASGSSGHASGFYVFGNDGDYCYYIKCFNRMHKALTDAFINTSKRDMYNNQLSVFKDLSSWSTTTSYSFYGQMFERLIRLNLAACEAQLGSQRYGLESKTCTVKVNKVFYPTNEHELMKMAEDERKQNEGTTRIWCDLNHKNQRFKAYSFAYIELNDKMYGEFILFQATVNPVNHRTKAMEDVLDKVKGQCKLFVERSRGFVEACFLCPASYKGRMSISNYPVLTIDTFLPM